MNLMNEWANEQVKSEKNERERERERERENRNTKKSMVNVYLNKCKQLNQVKKGQKVVNEN